jgi:HlyD family secretion protein
MALEINSLDGLKIDRSRPRSRWPFFLLLLLLLLLFGGGGAGAWWWVNQPGKPVVKTFVVVEPRGGSGDRTSLNASGYVTARRQATVSSKVTGKVVEVFVEEGKRVTKGQVLARLDASNTEQSLKLAQAQLAAAKASLGETQANLEQAKRELKQNEDLMKQRAGVQRELDRAATEVQSFVARLARQTADVAVAQSEIATWEQQIDDSTIRAPFEGIVTSKNAQPGEMISPMSSGGFTRTGICTIVDMTSLEIEVDVGESFINRVQPGQPVVAKLDSYPDWQIPATVIAIIPTADRQKATVKVRVAFDKLDERILPDMSVKAAFQSPAPAVSATTKPTITIPKAALVQKDNRDIVWVIKDNKAERRAVTVTPVGSDQLAVAAGLSSGEKIVIEGTANLSEGITVTEAKR